MKMFPACYFRQQLEIIDTCKEYRQPSTDSDLTNYNNIKRLTDLISNSGYELALNIVVMWVEVNSNRNIWMDSIKLG